jgi:hypothetical protein
MMLNRTLSKMREKIRTRQYVMTLHAEEEMNDDDLTIYDVERGILTGKIVERQKDSKTGEWKYLIKGLTFFEDEVMVVVKFGPTDKLVIITLYLEKE